jgi:hypothetical protein
MIYGNDGIIKGTTVDAMYLTFFEGVGEDKVPSDLTGYAVRLFIRRDGASGAKVKELVCTVSGNRVDIASWVADLAAGKYYYDLRLVSPAGAVKTYLEGSELKIVQNVTD